MHLSNSNTGFDKKTRAKVIHRPEWINRLLVAISQLDWFKMGSRWLCSSPQQYTLQCSTYLSADANFTPRLNEQCSHRDGAIPRWI